MWGVWSLFEVLEILAVENDSSQGYTEKSAFRK